MINESQLNTLLARSHLLRCATNLAYDRSLQLDGTLRTLGMSSMPEPEDELLRLQLQTAQEIGGIRTLMLLDASREIMMYHFGPLQVALCLLHVALEYYGELAKSGPVFRSKPVDNFLGENSEFVERLKDLRNSVLHSNLDNMPKQKEFVSTYSGSSHKHLVAVLVEGERTYREYVQGLCQSSGWER